MPRSSLANTCCSRVGSPALWEARLCMSGEQVVSFANARCRMTCA